MLFQKDVLADKQECGLDRRIFLAGFAGGLAALACPTVSRAATTGRCSRLAIADAFEFDGNLLGAMQIQERLSLFQSLGIGTIRTQVGWGDVEATKGVATAIDSRYLLAAKAAGFKFKMRVATIGGAPSWLFTECPDAMIQNAAGETSVYTIDLWLPGLAALLAQKAALVFERLVSLDLMSSINYLIIDLGQAAEPIYPPAFVEGSTTLSTTSFWYYSKNARESFQAAMSVKYGTIILANEVWGSSYNDFGSVIIPSPGQVAGVMWNDVLTWYRNSKREIISQQVLTYRRLVQQYVPNSPPKLVILVPGQHLPAGLWQDSVETGAADYNLEIMEDTAYLIDLARSSGCLIQYTSAQTLGEVQYIQNYLNRGRNLELFGENAGSSNIDYIELTSVIVAEGLYGLDYVNSSDFLASDGITPTANFSAFKTMCGNLVSYLGVDM